MQPASGLVLTEDEKSPLRHIWAQCSAVEHCTTDNAGSSGSERDLAERKQLR